MAISQQAMSSSVGKGRGSRHGRGRRGRGRGNPLVAVPPRVPGREASELAELGKFSEVSPQPGRSQIPLVVPISQHEERSEEGIVKDPARDKLASRTATSGLASPRPTQMICGQPDQITTGVREINLQETPYLPSRITPVTNPSPGVVKKGPVNYYDKKQPPDRPGYGKQGREILVRSNYFPLLLPRHMSVHHYDVAIVPGKLPKHVSRLVSVMIVLPLCHCYKLHRVILQGSKL